MAILWVVVGVVVLFAIGMIGEWLWPPAAAKPKSSHDAATLNIAVTSTGIDEADAAVERLERRLLSVRNLMAEIIAAREPLAEVLQEPVRLPERRVVHVRDRRKVKRTK